MEVQLISFDTAKLTKEIGFDEQCNDCYDQQGHLYSNGWCERLDDFFEESFSNSEIDNLKFDYLYYTRPTQPLLQKWFRIIHNIDIEPVCIYLFGNKSKKLYNLKITYSTSNSVYIKSEIIGRGDIKMLFDTYEDALEKGLEEASLIIKNLQNVDRTV